jgi:hypothetical protein
MVEPSERTVYRRDVPRGIVAESTDEMSATGSQWRIGGQRTQGDTEKDGVADITR